MIFSFISSLVEKIISLVDMFGYLGIFIGMAFESTFLPVPSELILIPAGILVAKGQFSFLTVLLVATLGSMLGALVNYSLALLIGRTAVNALVSRYGKFLFISEKNLLHSEKFFNNHGGISTFLGRFIPGVRHLISIPAGFFRMKLTPFLILTGIGSGIWSAILILVGYLTADIPTSFLRQNSFALSMISIGIGLSIIITYLLLKKK